MVMKKTKRKHLLKTIQKTGVSFFAVAFIAATSIAIFLGLQSSAAAILKQADRYFKDNRLETFEITCANGITEEDIEAVRGWEDVESAEGGYVSTAVLHTEGENILVQTRSLCEDMNLPVIMEGRLPQSAGEAAIEEKLAEEKEIGIGDTITLAHDGELKSDTFEVTAIINEPLFDSVNISDARGKAEAGLGSNDYYIELSEDAFDSSYYSGCFTTAYIYSSSFDGIYYFSDEYQQKEEEMKEKLETLAQERAQLRYETLKEEARSEIDDARAEIDKAQEELDEGREQISEKKEELDSALAEIQGQLAFLGLDTDLDNALSKLTLLGAAGEEMKTVITQYQEGFNSLLEAEKEIEDGDKELEDLRQELADAEEDAAGISLEDWILSGRNDAGDVRSVETIVESIYGLSYSLSMIFLFVSIIVCYAAITRMINEQRTMVGTQKAVGFTSGEILRHYLLYNALCALLGILIGWAASVGIVEILVLYVFSPEFLFGSISLTFEWGFALAAAGICLVVFLTATYAACAKLIRLPATELLRGEVPEKGKRFFFEGFKGYKKMKLYSRTMVKNVINDKGRMMTTVTGIMGCIALLVICFSMKMGIENSSVVQFDKYYLYENRLIFDSSKGNAKEFEKVLQDKGVDYTAVSEKLENFRVSEGSWENVHILTTEDFEQLKDFIYLEDIHTKTTAQVPEDGILVSRKCAEDFDLSEGSVVELMDSDGKARECRVAGVIEHYLPWHVFVASESYLEVVLKEEPDICVFLLKGDISGVLEEVQDMDGFLSLKDNRGYAANADSINMVIAVCLALAVVMVLLVLMNQIVMYINRKARELSVMRVNGYTMKETKAYVYKDNIVLTGLGLLLGSGAGVGLSYVIMRIIETGANRYVRTPNLLACLYSCAVVAVFAIIVNIIALRKINHLNLTNVSAN